MTDITIGDLQESLLHQTAFTVLDDYKRIAVAFLEFSDRANLTRIVSPSHSNYIFYQYGEGQDHKITRPLNSHLYLSSPNEFLAAFERFVDFLAFLRTSSGKGRYGSQQ